MTDRLEKMLIKHEGLKLKPYRCTAGKLTIGVGRNIEDVGITDAEARMMLNYDIQERVTQFLKYDWFTELSEVRKDVIIDMSFMGVSRLLGFKKMIKALSEKDFDKAAEEMMNSKWASQVGKRATELAAMMIEDRYFK